MYHGCTSGLVCIVCVGNCPRPWNSSRYFSAMSLGMFSGRFSILTVATSVQVIFSTRSSILTSPMALHDSNPDNRRCARVHDEELKGVRIPPGEALDLASSWGGYLMPTVSYQPLTLVSFNCLVRLSATLPNAVMGTMLISTPVSSLHFMGTLSCPTWRVM